MFAFDGKRIDKLTEPYIYTGKSPHKLLEVIFSYAVIFSFEANFRSCDGEKLEIRRNQENAEILNTDSKAQVTRGYSGKYGTSNKLPCCININITRDLVLLEKTAKIRSFRTSGSHE